MEIETNHVFLLELLNSGLNEIFGNWRTEPRQNYWQSNAEWGLNMGTLVASILVSIKYLWSKGDQFQFQNIESQP